MNPIRLTAALFTSLMVGWLFMLISVPRYYGLLFNIENVSEFGFLTQQYFSELSVSAQHPLLVGLLLGCTLATIFYNLIRYLYARFTCNLLLAIALSMLLLFLFFLANISAAPTSFYVNFTSDFIYAPIVLCMLFTHSLCLQCIPKRSKWKRLKQQIMWHMTLLGIVGVALLLLKASAAHLLTYCLLISSAVYVLGSLFLLWQNQFNPARTLLIGFLILFVALIAVWPSFTNESFISPTIAIITALIAVPLAGFIISAGLSESHYAQWVKRANQSKQYVSEQAEQRAKSELLAKISHEIRTPLSGVLGMATLLLDTPLSSKQRDYAQTLHSSGNELLSLINEILDISRLESNEIVLGYSEFNLASLLRECTQAFEHTAQEQQVEFAVFLQPQAPETLMGDPVRLRQILLSILKNAFQRTQQGEVILSVTVENSANNSQLVFCVQDNGTPLSDEERHTLSTAQLQSKDLLSASFIGGHLGIITANQLLSLMNGSLNIQSIDDGNQFTFNIPLSPADLASTSSKDDAVLHNKKILIIDSNTLYQKVLAQQCSEWGLQVATRSSSTDAMAYLRNQAHQGQRFAAILISEDSNKTKAIEFAVRLKEDPLLAQDTTLIMLTSSSDTDPVTTRNAGIAYVLMKPLSGSTLKTTLRRAFARQPLGSQAQQQLSGKHILVVEDNLISVKVISGLLRTLGATVDVAANGEIALVMMQKNTFDLVLMDCEMPVMDGFTATQQRREYEARHGLKRLPIFALSAHVLPEHKQRVRQAGMDGHLAKPIELTKLQELLKDLSF